MCQNCCGRYYNWCLLSCSHFLSVGATGALHLRVIQNLAVVNGINVFPLLEQALTSPKVNPQKIDSISHRQIVTCYWVCSIPFQMAFIFGYVSQQCLPISLQYFQHIGFGSAFVNAKIFRIRYQREMILKVWCLVTIVFDWKSIEMQYLSRCHLIGWWNSLFASWV